MINGKEYVAGTITGSWQENVDYCADNGMILATFDGAADVQKIYDTCGAQPTGVCYLGFEDIDNNGVFNFIDDSEVVDTEAAGLILFGGNDLGSCCCGCIVTALPMPEVLANCACDGFQVTGVCEILDVAPEPICDGMLYIFYFAYNF